MSSTGDNIGMMEGAFFVGRKAILDWLNEFLLLNLGKIEECCTGSIACQICDSLYPGKVNMSKVSVAAHKHVAPSPSSCPTHVVTQTKKTNTNLLQRCLEQLFKMFLFKT